jgi:hypothetical protein
MSGVLYIEAASVEATSGQMLVTFTSGGEDFRFHLPPHVAIKFRQKIIADGWQVCCAPDAEVVPIRPARRKGGKL